MPLSREPSPRYKLNMLAKRLRKLSFPSSPIPIKLAQFAADAIERYCADKTGTLTLDAAFGLRKKKRGTPGYPKRRVKIARAVLDLRLKGRSWNQITTTLQKDFGVMDIPTIKRTYKEFAVPVMARQIARELKADKSD